MLNHLLFCSTVTDNVWGATDLSKFSVNGAKIFNRSHVNKAFVFQIFSLLLSGSP